MSGELPYQDIWDHKPPVIFYINALGLALADYSRWGVWLLELVSLTVAALIAFHLLRKMFGVFPALYSLLIGLLTLTFLIQGGNLTTEYTLPLQICALWLVHDANEAESPSWRWFLTGALGAIAFFTKQTAVGIWIAIFLYLMLVRRKRIHIKRWLCDISCFAGGGLSVSIALIVFFGTQGAIAQFWNAAFKYNLIYSSSATNLAYRLRPLLTGITPLTKLGLLQFAMIGYAFGVILILFGKDIIRAWQPLLSIALISLPIELIFVTVSGRTYPHYYMSLLPVLFVFSGLFFWVMLSQLSTWNIPNAAQFAFQLSIIAIILWSSSDNYRDQVVDFRTASDDTVISYVKSRTAPDDYVLFWGAEASVNFFTGRRSPTRFVYQYPLYTLGYVDEGMILEFLQDIVQRKPRLIIDTRNPRTPIFDFPIHSEMIGERVAYLKSHYKPTANLGDWIAYKYEGSAGVP